MDPDFQGNCYVTDNSGTNCTKNIKELWQYIYVCVTKELWMYLSVSVSFILSCINAFDFETFMPKAINVNLEFTSKIIFMCRN